VSSPLVLVPFAAVFVVLAFAVACAVVALTRLIPFDHPRRSRIPQTSLWAAAALAPIVIGALGCAALASPAPFSGCHCAQHGLHHPHLCLIHPAFAEPLLAPAACLLAAWGLLVAPRLFRLAADVMASERWGRARRRLPAELLDGVPIRLADCADRGAVTAGALAPVIVFDRALWDGLSPEARRAVVHHEHAHAERRDGLTLLALRLCAALFPVPGRSRLIERWREAVEAACDAHAAQTIGDPGTVAAALVAVEKARALPPRSRVAAPALGVAAGGDLERRVMALLRSDEDAGRRAPLGNDALAVAIVSLGAAALTLAWPGSEFHHAVETLIGLLVH
jgi:hypothetical protein